MCIIAVSKKHERQPTVAELRAMFRSNPHGAGYMFARDGKVTIHKGFMDEDEFVKAVRAENFTIADPVVYHFRISTQAGIRPEMTHPFPLTGKLELTGKLDLTCPVGLAHNGIIRMTSDPRQSRWSDTALFITGYMSKLIRRRSDISDPNILTMIEKLTESKWAIMDGATGNIETVGRFISDRGMLFSNATYMTGCNYMRRCNYAV